MTMSEITYLGSFDLTGDILRISDPCYNDDIWRTKTVKAKPGKWHAYAKTGERIERLFCLHKTDGYISEFCGDTFEVGVDSGQRGTFDEAHYKDDSVAVGQELVSEHSPIDPDDPWYSLCCDKTLCEPMAGVIPFGVVSSSGYGDGCYNVRIKSVDGVCVGVEIVFIEDV